MKIFKKNMKRTVILLAVLFVIYLCVGIVKYFTGQYYFRNIKKITVIPLNDSNADRIVYFTEDEKKIGIFRKCLFKCFLNNNFRIRFLHDETMPQQYEITYVFENSITEKYFYKAYSGECFYNPFDDFFDLFDINP